jgi:hypothetical protein
MIAMREEMDGRFKEHMRLMQESQSEILALLKDPQKLITALYRK